MACVNTKEDVYNSIKFFVFKNWEDKDLDRLRVFVDNLFDHNQKEVAPFDRLITSHLRIYFYINNWYQIINEYKKVNFDILSDDFDLGEVSTLLYQYVTNPKEFENIKTRE
ncbi:MAG: hypothetical protein IKX00_03575 [Bacilli bacterium]|nr:hypothetical protein [Bacilli bacterium]